MHTLKTFLLLLTAVQSLRVVTKMPLVHSFKGSMQKSLEKESVHVSPKSLAALSNSKIFSHNEECAPKLPPIKFFLFASKAMVFVGKVFYLMLMYCSHGLVYLNIKKFFKSTISDFKNFLKMKEEKCSDENANRKEVEEEANQEQAFKVSTNGSALFCKVLTQQIERSLYELDVKLRDLIKPATFTQDTPDPPKADCIGNIDYSSSKE
jgi:hypothetical protein